ncbi:MAG: glycerophosphodiester phosphodiesterase family protein [Pseudomonadota bacterium]
MKKSLAVALMVLNLLVTVQGYADTESVITLGPRPANLLASMRPGALKTRLQSCIHGPFRPSDWSIGHRGAPAQFPEHTRESNIAAARMGAGILECDVTFTRDRELVCRHAQDDLHTSTDILSTALADRCVQPSTATSDNVRVDAQCRTSDITLSEFKALRGIQDIVNSAGHSATQYIAGAGEWRKDRFAATGTLLTHKEHIELVKSLGLKFMPELKAPVVDMPFEGDYSQVEYAQQLIDEYKQAGVSPADVFVQSFNLDDVLYWIENEPEFGEQAVYLDDSYAIEGWSPSDPSTWRNSMRELKSMGINYVAPPIWVLLSLEDNRIVPSVYARRATAAGLKIITWTVERSASISSGGGWYYQSVSERLHRDGDVFEVMHALHREVGVVGIFSDWPATTTFYANCFDL